MHPVGFIIRTIFIIIIIILIIIIIILIIIIIIFFLHGLGRLTPDRHHLVVREGVFAGLNDLTG